MEKILSNISSYMNGFILVAGVGLVVLIGINTYNLGKHKSKIETVMDGKRTKTYIKKKTGEMYESEEAESATINTIRNHEIEFNKTCSLYNMYTQLIPIFPLLGILGTVAGLMSQVVAERNDAFNASLNVALGSTFWGLIFAIILKIGVILFPGRIVDSVEIMLDDYYNKFNDAIIQKNISEE